MNHDHYICLNQHRPQNPIDMNTTRSHIFVYKLLRSLSFPQAKIWTVFLRFIVNLVWETFAGGVFWEDTARQWGNWVKSEVVSDNGQWGDKQRHFIRHCRIKYVLQNCSELKTNLFIFYFCRHALRGELFYILTQWKTEGIFAISWFPVPEIKF